MRARQLTAVICVIVSVCIQTPQAARSLRINIPGAVTQGVTDISSNGRSVVGAYCDARSNCFQYLWHQGELTTISVAGAMFNTVRGVNVAGDVVGYASSQTSQIGYLRRRDGTITGISCPFATWIEPAAINNSRTVTGIWFGSGEGERGAFRWQNGRCERLPVGDVAYPLDISSNGIIVGFAGASSELEPFYAFMLRGGEATVIEHPDAPFAAGGGTMLVAVASNGLALGWWNRDATSDLSGITGWFLYHDGVFDHIDVPGNPIAISSAGVITYEDSDDAIRTVRARSILVAN